MGINIAAIKTALHAWCTDETGELFIFTSQNAPKPTGPFGTIRINSNLTLNRAIKTNTREIDENITTDYEISGILMVSINTYKDDALQLISNLKSSLDKDSVIDYFNSNNIGILNQSEIRNINEVENKEWEERGQCDFFFNVISSTQETGGNSIEKIEVTDEINNDIIIVEKPTP